MHITRRGRCPVEAADRSMPKQVDHSHVGQSVEGELHGQRREQELQDALHGQSSS